MHNDVARSARSLAGRRPDDAVALLEAAGAQGDAGAMAELAAWHLRGDLVPRDLLRARGALRRAVEIGHVDAALLEIALLANGSGGSPDWPRAMHLLAQAARSDTVAAEHLALIEALALDDAGYPAEPPAAEILHDYPFVARFRCAVSPAECLHIAGVANAMLEPAVVVDPATGRSIAHPVRTSFSAAIGPAQETLPIAAFNRRLAAITDTRLDQGEPLQVLRYAPGQQFKLHSDALPGAANQRIMTAIAYLNDGFAGGDTSFPALGLQIKPAAGDILVFHNALGDGTVLPEARHAGLPVVAGLKWIATRWIRMRTYDAWKDPR